MNWIIFLLSFSHHFAFADDFVSGVSTEAISLPSAPGSVDGMPMTFAEQGNKGNFSFDVDIQVPVGVNKHTPQLRLHYSSNDGQSEFGLGWSLQSYEIQVSTKKGVPFYDERDSFWGPDGELVKIEKAGSSNEWYSPYINTKQNLYEYDRNSNFWIIHEGAGRKIFLGQDTNSRIESDGKIFKWKVVKVEDNVGNKIRYEYIKSSGFSLLSKVKYAYKGSVAHYQVQFLYEDRLDQINSYKSSFLVQNKKRCREIRVVSGENYIIRSYKLVYKDQEQTYSTALEEIRQHGEQGLDLSPPMPPVKFEYNSFSFNSNTKTNRIQFTDTSVFPPSLNKKRATIVDINRDSFPDILETSRKGATVWLNDGSGVFQEHYKLPSFISVLGEGQSTLIDVDGDRVVDFLATGLYPQFFKGGFSYPNEKLGFSSSPTEIKGIPHYSIGSPDVKTIDINGDGRLDILAREVGNYKSFFSTESGDWNRAEDYVVDTGAFDISSPYSFFADMNGDGLVDLVFVKTKSVIFLPNNGTGKFQRPEVIDFDEADPLILNLFKIGKYNFVVDINGDGYADLISASESTVAISLNKGSNKFSETFHLTDIHQEKLDLKGLHITTSDINGNGTTDILWTNDFHDWRYLDFSTGFQHLLSKVDNGIGLKTLVEYARATDFGSHTQAQTTILPHPTIVVKSVKESLGEASNYIKNSQYSYYGGYYNAYENDFRGFSLVEQVEEGDSSIASSYILSSYEQGRTLVKDHQQLMLKKKSEYEYNFNNSTVGELLKEEQFQLATIYTFPTENIRKIGFPYVQKTTITEGDSDPFTSNRQHKVERFITLSEDGFIKKDRTVTYLDLIQILRQEEKVLAVINAINSHVVNRVCESSILDSSNALLERTRYYYDGQATLCFLTNGLATKKESWIGGGYELKNTYTYHSFGALASFSDSLSHVTTISYDSLNLYPISVINGAMHSKQASYNINNGLMSSYSDENGLIKSYYYDTYQRLTKIVGPADSFTLPTEEMIYSFGNSSGVFSSIFNKKREKSGQSGTLDTKEYFDGKKRSVFKITEGPSNKYVLEGTAFNMRGEKFLVLQKSFTDSFNVPSNLSGIKFIKNHYDSLKRPLMIFNPEHSTNDPSYKEFSYLVGQTILYDEKRNISYEYNDSLGRRTGHKDALGNEVNYEFNPRDLLTKIIDPKLSETHFSYDSEQRRICKIDPVTGLTRYSYNSEGLLVQKDMYGFVNGQSACTPPNGVTPRIITFEYNDGINRMTKIDFPSGSNTEDIIYSYDEVNSSYGVGKLTAVDFGKGSKIFDYDIYGNQYKTTLNIASTSYVTEKKMDAIGRIEEIVYPTIGSNVFGIKYAFDESSNLVEVKNGSTNFLYAKDITYSPMKQVENIEFGNNVKSTMSYDDIDQTYRLVSILTEKIGTPNTTIQNLSYNYDKVSNVIERNDSKNSFAESYNYDELNRLVSASLGGVSKTWSFDEIGNITSNNSVPYAYNSLRNQIVDSVGANNYTFDNFGNIAQDASRAYVFDWNNRLRSVTKSFQTTTYDYGEDGLRVLKKTPTETTIFIDKYTELRGSEVVRHIYADKQLIASIDELNNVTYNHKDHLGSSNLKTDSSGNVIKRIEYLPFGDKRIEVGSYNKINNRFTGQYEDDESGLYYYQQRYYDPILSRFISADPLYLEEMDERGMDSQELNLYTYVRNNPSNYIDPNGLDAIYVTAGVVAGLSQAPRSNEGNVISSSSGLIVGTEGNMYKMSGMISSGIGEKIAGGVLGAGINLGYVFGDISSLSGAGKMETYELGPYSFSTVMDAQGNPVAYEFSMDGIGGGIAEHMTNTETIIGDILTIGGGNNSDLNIGPSIPANEI